MKFNAKDLSPWPDFQRVMANANSLKVKAGGKTYGGTFDLSRDEATGEVTLDFGGKAAPKEAPAKKAAPKKAAKKGGK